VKIQNETRYDGRDIRGLFCACASYSGVSMAGGPLRNLTLSVVYYAPRQHSVTAHGNTLKIIRTERLAVDAIDQLGGLASGGAAIPQPVLIDLCSLVSWYVQGTKEKCRWYKTVPKWAEGRRVRIKPLPSEPEKLTGVAYQKAEITKAEAKLAAWEKKRKRAESAVKKLKREIRERRGRIKRLQSQR